jgi:small subunit ribosomal protein S20
MANIASQKKRILRTERERLENRRYTSAIKTAHRQLEAAVKAGDADETAAAQRKYASLVGKAVKSGALHRNTGSRKIARAARFVKAGNAA